MASRRTVSWMKRAVAVTTQNRSRLGPLFECCGQRHDISHDRGRGFCVIPIAQAPHHDEPGMQAHAQRHWHPSCYAKALLVCGQTPSQFERHAYCPPGIVFVSDRDPEHGHEARAHHRMEPPSILTYHVLGQGMECEKQTVQDIEIDTRSMRRCCGHRTAEYGDRLTLGLARRCRDRAGRRWRHQRLPTGSAEHCWQRHVLATVDTKLPQTSATRRAEDRGLVIGVLAGDAESY